MIEIEILFPPSSFPVMQKCVQDLRSEFDLDDVPVIETRGRSPMGSRSIRRMLGMKRRDFKTVKLILGALITALCSAGSVGIIIRVAEYNTEVRIENKVNIIINGNVIVKDA